MSDDYDWESDALGSYTVAMKAIGAKAKETGIIPECLLGDGEHTQRLLAEREQTHGAFYDNARIAQHLRDFYRQQPGWEDMTVSQREAFDMDATKRARILSGQACHPDHWDDCAGYALLGKRDCDG